MERELQQSRLELEARVNQRTAQLKEQTRQLEREIDRRRVYEAELKARGEAIVMEVNRRRFLSKKMVDLLERDRREIGRSLHDEVGQLLAVIHMDLDLLKTNPQRDVVAFEEKIAKIQKRIEGVSEYVRDVSHRLRPDILDHFGLEAAVRNLMEPFEKTPDIRAHVFIKNLPRQMDPGKELAVFRIVQEAVTNILRYACAKNIFVNIIKKDSMIIVSVEDDGKGFEYDKIAEPETSKGKLGLAIMNERAVQLGGTLHIDSAIGKGTHVYAEIPVE